MHAPGKLVHQPGFRFAFVFTVCLLIGFGVLFSPAVQFVDQAISRGLVGIAWDLIRLFGGHASREAAILRAPGGFAVEMRDGCNAVNVTLLLWSAVLAFPSSWRPKLLGIVGGALIIQVVNLFRFITLFYLGQFSTSWFDFAHSYLWESLIILDTLVVFWFWVTRFARSGGARVRA